MAQVQVLHDVLQSGIRWRVTLHGCPDQGCLVRFEKSGKGGRLLHQESAQWNRLAGGFLLPRERVAGGMVPKISGGAHRSHPAGGAPAGQAP
jgi:hypothetical protein